MSWKPGDKCRVCGCEVTIAAIAGEDVWCRDANGQHYTHALSDLRPFAPAEPEPPKRNTPEYLNTAYDRLDRAVQDVLKWSPDALRELVGAAMSMRDRAHNALDTHATPPAPALEPLDEEAVWKALQEIVVVDSLGQRVDGDSYRLVSSSAWQMARALCQRFGVAPAPPPDEVREKAVECLIDTLPLYMGPTSHALRAKVCNAVNALASSGLLAGGDAALKAEVERLRAALPTEEEILAMRYLKGYAHLCDTPEVETFRAYLARTEAQA